MFLIELQELKNKLETNSLNDDSLIFIGDYDSFLIRQYLSKISEIKNSQIKYLQNISEILSIKNSLFLTELNNDIKVLVIQDELINCADFQYEKNLILISKDEKKFENLDLVKSRIVRFPDLENWQIKDWVYSVCEGVNTQYLDWLLEVCNYNIDRLSLEIDKILLFNKEVRNDIFKLLVENGNFDDVSDNTIFTLSNAISSKDLNKICEILSEISILDIEPIGLNSVLYQNFRKLILVWCSNNPTPENTGLKSNQIWAINKLPRTFSKEQLINIFSMLTSIDKKIKTGNLETKYLIDYLICKILSE